MASTMEECIVYIVGKYSLQFLNSIYATTLNAKFISENFFLTSIRSFSDGKTEQMKTTKQNRLQLYNLNTK